MYKSIASILFDNENGLETVKEHLRERTDYYRKHNIPEVSNLVEEAFLTDSLFVVPFEDKEKIFLVSYEDHKIILKDYTSAIIKVIELSGLCYPNACKSFTDILNLFKDRMRITKAEETLSVIEIFLFNVIYQVKETSAVSCNIQVEYLMKGKEVC